MHCPAWFCTTRLSVVSSADSLSLFYLCGSRRIERRRVVSTLLEGTLGWSENAARTVGALLCGTAEDITGDPDKQLDRTESLIAARFRRSKKERRRVCVLAFAVVFFLLLSST